MVRHMDAVESTPANERDGSAGESPVRRDEQRHDRNRALVRRWRDAEARGDRACAEELFARTVEENMGLAAWWARRYAGVCVQDEYATLELAAREGLERAVATWDTDGGSTLATWSSQPIRSRLQRRVEALYGRRFAPVAHLVVRARREVEAELGRPATLEEVGERTGLISERVEAIEAAVADIRGRARALRLDDDRHGDRHQRVSAAGPATTADHGATLAGLLADAELPRRWQRLARHLAVATRTRTLEEAVAAYADAIGASVEDVSTELAQLVAHLGRSR